MDAAQYDAKILAATMLLAGAPEAATHSTARAFARAARVHGDVSLPGQAWYELKTRMDAARKTIADAAARWRDDLTDAAKDQVRKAVKAVEDAIEGAKEAAHAAKSTAEAAWDELKQKADDVASTVGLGLGAFAGGVGLVWLLVLGAVLLSASGRARPSEHARFVSSRS